MEETLFKIEVDAKQALENLKELKAATEANKKEMAETKAALQENADAMKANADAAADLAKKQDTITKSLEELDKQQKLNGDLTADQTKEYDNLKQSLTDINAQLADNQQQAKNLSAIDSELSGKVEMLNARQKMYNESIRDNRKVVELSVNQAKLQEGSILAMRKEVSALTAEYQRLSQTEREGAKGQELQKKLKSLNESINKNMLAVSSFKDNIGNYMSALNGLGGPMASATQAFGLMQNGVGGVSKAFTTLMAHPIVAFLALLVGTLIKAAQAIKDNEELSNRLEVAFAALNPIIDVLKNALDALATGIVFLVEKFSELVTWIAGTSEEAQKAIESAKELTKAEQDLAKRQREFKVEAAKSEMEIAELKEKAKDKEKYTAKERLQFIDETIRMETKLAEERKAQAEERLRLLKLEADRTANDKAANDALAEAEAEVYRQETALSAKKRELTEQRNAAIQQIRAEEKAIRDAADAEAKALADAMQKMLKANEDAMQKVADDAQKRMIETSNKRLQMLIESNAEYDRIEEEAATLRFNKEMQLETEREAKIAEINNNELLTEETKNAMLIELKLQFNIRLQEIDDEYTQHLISAKDIEDARVKKSLDQQAKDLEAAKKREAESEARYQAKKNAILKAGATFSGAISDELAQQNRFAFEAKKAADIASAITNTYQAATGSYSALASIPYVGPALGAAAAAAAVASGVLNVRSIARTKFGDGNVDSSAAPTSVNTSASTAGASSAAEITPYATEGQSSLSSLGALQTAGAVQQSGNIANDIVSGVSTAIADMPSPTLNIVEFQEAEENFNRKVQLTE